MRCCNNFALKLNFYAKIGILQRLKNFSLGITDLQGGMNCNSTSTYSRQVEGLSLLHSGKCEACDQVIAAASDALPFTDFNLDFIGSGFVK